MTVKNIDFDPVAELYDLYANTTYDLEFWRSVAAASAAPRLELLCGTGRILASLGVEAEGLDYSEGLLAVARRKLPLATLHMGDARDFSLGKTYGLIFLAFQSISEVISNDDKRRVFECVRRHLDGRFWVTAHEPSQRRAMFDGREIDLGTHAGVRVTGSYRIGEGNLVTGVQRYRGARTVDLPMRFHLIEPAELERLLVESGFRIEERYGDYDRSASGPFVILGCRSAAEVLH